MQLKDLITTNKEKYIKKRFIIEQWSENGIFQGV